MSDTATRRAELDRLVVRTAELRREIEVLEDDWSRVQVEIARVEAELEAV